MSIGKKITLSFAAFVALLVTLGIIAILNLGSINASLQLVSSEGLPGIHQIVGLMASAKEQKVSMLQHIASADAGEKAAFEREISDGDAQVRKSLDEILRLVHSPQARDAVQKISAAQDDMLRVWSKIQPLSRAGQTKEAAAVWTSEGVSAGRARQRTIDSLSDILRNDSETLAQAAAENARSARTWIWIVLSVSLLLCGGCGYWIVRGIGLSLGKSVHDLTRNAELVSSAAGQVSSSSQSLANGATRQAASLEETSASTEEIASMVQKNAESCQQVVMEMAQVDSKVVEANRALEQMVGSMQEINSSSRNISKIIKVIDEIAFQTNILSLNAAVEAARAGEAGMGFAVVAEEVRNLAQRSAQSARDTATLIEESISRSAEGQTKLGLVASAIRGITESAATVKNLVDEVSQGSQDQARGINHVSKAVAEMDKLVQTTAASAEESAAASQELSGQAEAMMKVVKGLHVLVGGEYAAERRTSRTRGFARSAPGFGKTAMAR